MAVFPRVVWDNLSAAGRGSTRRPQPFRSSLHLDAGLSDDLRPFGGLAADVVRELFRRRRGHRDTELRKGVLYVGMAPGLGDFGLQPVDDVAPHPGRTEQGVVDGELIP